jgi:hypothetical protein
MRLGRMDIVTGTSTYLGAAGGISELVKKGN